MCKTRKKIIMNLSSSIEDMNIYIYIYIHIYLVVLQ